jgi:translation initiation factor 2 alpha subunit (eIF-2alpha)
MQKGFDMRRSKLEMYVDVLKVLAQRVPLKLTHIIYSARVKCIQDAFIGAKKSQKAKDAKIEFSIIAAPRYSVEVSADNWKRAEELLEKVSESVVTNITKAGGYGVFKREK